jgi:hypothetical protein
LKVNGGDNSTDSENTSPNRRPIHIHGGMEHNLAGYAKYYSCGCTKIFGSNEFTKERITVEDIFLNISKKMLKTNYALNLG